MSVRDQMNDEEFSDMLRQSMKEAENGLSKDADSVFARLKDEPCLRHTLCSSLRLPRLRFSGCVSVDALDEHPYDCGCQ